MKNVTPTIVSVKAASITHLGAVWQVCVWRVIRLVEDGLIVAHLKIMRLIVPHRSHLYRG